MSDEYCADCPVPKIIEEQLRRCKRVKENGFIEIRSNGCWYYTCNRRLDGFRETVILEEA